MKTVATVTYNYINSDLLQQTLDWGQGDIEITEWEPGKHCGQHSVIMTHDGRVWGNVNSRFAPKNPKNHWDC